MVSKKTKLKRLNLLVYMLENHKKIFPKVKFNLFNWAENTPKKNNSKAVSCLLDGQCGTAACAIGSAALYKPFNRRGLKLLYFGRTSKNRNQFELRYGHYHDWLAVEKFFDMEKDEAEYLFSRWSYTFPTRRKVITRLKTHIKKL